MQRRAAALFAAFFIVVAAASYAVIGVAQEPSVAVADPDHSLEAGDQLTVDGRTYTVARIESGSAELTWVNESAKHTVDLANDSTVPPADVQWEGQVSRQSATFENGSTVTVGDSDYQVIVAAGESPSEFTLAGGDSSETYAVGDPITYQGNQANVSRVTPQQVTIVWGESYRLQVENASDPSSFTFRQEFNVTKRLAEDPAVEDETVTRTDGREYVVYRENGTTQPVSEYLPAPETREFSEGDQIQYRTDTATVANVSSETVTLEWTAPRTNTISLEEGGTTTLGDTEYVAHLPGDGTLALSSDVEGYDRQTEAVATFQERMSGLWGISIISGLAAIFLLAMAYLPSRY